ncbi:hypothetical protein IQ22_00332 [Pseudomonas duriflava]|uniref:Uncharacterized protein n=1 Tax=Pseudomonas duriflava TaxID=459528 RepID=A0A562QPG4_9PSED|nr:hypothetical protein [Pseudomonas duriflava]TWI58624.1 hypothetical protein IQ22_00332 [Pseudomonas duriflava]
MSMNQTTLVNQEDSEEVMGALYMQQADYLALAKELRQIAQRQAIQMSQRPLACSEE